MHAMVGINIRILHLLHLAKIAENRQASEKFNHENRYRSLFAPKTDIAVFFYHYLLEHLKRTNLIFALKVYVELLKYLRKFSRALLTSEWYI